MLIWSSFLEAHPAFQGQICLIWSIRLIDLPARSTCSELIYCHYLQAALKASVQGQKAITMAALEYAKDKVKSFNDRYLIVGSRLKLIVATYRL